MKDILKNKAVVLGLAIIAMVIFLAIASAGQEPAPAPAPSLTPAFKTSTLQITNLSDEKKSRAGEYRRSIADKLPIYVEKFKTSTGKETLINVYIYDKDTPEVIRLEVYGISYKNSESDPKKNPDAQAYADSYREAMRLLREKGIDPKQLVFAYNESDYIRTTVLKWIDDLNLSP